MLSGWARLRDAHTIELATLNADGTPGHQTWRAERILIATGGTRMCRIFTGASMSSRPTRCSTSTLPQRLVVVGGGYIACEFASIFNGLGAQVTQLYRGEQILRGFDDEVRHFLAGEMRKKGVDLRLQTGVVAVHREADGLHAVLEDGNRLVADAILYATGRVPNVQGLGLEALGVAQGAQGAIVVDEHYRTNVPSVYALGDVTARVQLTPVALAEAMALVDHLYGPAPGAALRSAHYDLIPTAVFTAPNVGTVGIDRGAGPRAVWALAHLPQRVPRPAPHAQRQRGAHPGQARGGRRLRPGGGPAPGRAGRGRNRAGLCRGAALRGHQSPVRRHAGHPPDDRRGVGHPARTGVQRMSATAGSVCSHSMGTSQRA